MKSLRSPSICYNIEFKVVQSLLRLLKTYFTLDPKYVEKLILSNFKTDSAM